MIDLNDIDSGITPIAAGDQFGWSLDIDYSGTTLLVDMVTDTTSLLEITNGKIK